MTFYETTWNLKTRSPPLFLIQPYAPCLPSVPPTSQHAKRMLDTRLGAALTLSMPFIVVILFISIFFGVTTYATSGLVPELNAQEKFDQIGDDNLFGTVLLHVDFAAAKGGSRSTDMTCSDAVRLVNPPTLLDCEIDPDSVYEAENEQALLLLCSIDVTCIVSNKIAGDQDVTLELLEAVQTMAWSVKPKTSWNHLRTEVNHTLRPNAAGNMVRQFLLERNAWKHVRHSLTLTSHRPSFSPFVLSLPSVIAAARRYEVEPLSAQRRDSSQHPRGQDDGEESTDRER